MNSSFNSAASYESELRFFPELMQTRPAHQIFCPRSALECPLLSKRNGYQKPLTSLSGGSFARTLLAFLCLCARAPATAQTHEAAMEGITVVADRGPHHRTLARLNWQTNSLGKALARTNSYVQLMTGLHYRDAAENWLESNPAFELNQQGYAIARYNPHQVIISPSLASSEGVVDLLTPDGKRLRSSILGLNLYDPVSGNTLQIGAVRDKPGTLVSPNEIVWFDAFDGLQADVRIRNECGSFHQDVLLRERISAEQLAELGFDEHSVRIEIWTEFLEAPDPQQRASLSGEPTGESTPVTPEQRDYTLDFGAMVIRSGGAFVEGKEETSVRIFKEWHIMGERRFLIESLRYSTLAPLLGDLPIKSAAFRTNGSSLRTAGKTPPSRPTAQSSSEPKNLMIARLAPFTGDRHVPRVVLDYPLTGTSWNLTLQGDTTYEIVGPCYLAGTTVIEGGAVIKSSTASGTGIVIAEGAVVCNTAPFRSAVFTSKHDDSAGTRISGSTGMPSRGDYHTGFSIQFEWADVVLHNLRITYADIGMRLEGYCGAQGTYRITDTQLVRCNTGIQLGAEAYSGYNTTQLYLGNVLFYEFRYSAIFSWDWDARITAEHVTAYNPSEDGVFFAGDRGSNFDFYLRNSLLCGASGIGTSIGAQPVPPTAFASQVGAGACYLADNTYRDIGTPAIDPELLASLKSKTTHPPEILSGPILDPKTLSPRQIRDSDGLPDYGYHYDPVDYAFSGISVSAHLTLTPGTVIASYGSQAGFFVNNAILAASGTPQNPVRITRYNCVQEQPGGSWAANWYNTPVCVESSYQSATVFEFTHWSLLAGNDMHLWDNYGYGQNTLRHCQFANGRISIEDASAEIFNCLFERAQVNLWEESGPAYFSLHNNALIGGQLSVRVDSTDAEIHDNFFSRTTISVQHFYAGINHSHNGYVQGYNRILSLAIGDVVLTSTAFETGPLGKFYYPSSGGSGTLYSLVNGGSRTANLAGLQFFTTQTSQLREGNTSPVDIGFHYAADSNTDGLPDYWMDQHGLDPDSLDGLDSASGDPDGDGVNNVAEYQAASSPVENDGLANPLALPPVGARYLRIISPTVIELVRIASDDTWNFSSSIPLPADFQVIVNGGSPQTPSAVGFKRRPLYQSYPVPSDTRIENTLYLTLGTPIEDNDVVQAQKVGAWNTSPKIWEDNLQFVATADPLRYSPAIHVNQDGYIASLTSEAKKAKIGYYLGASTAQGWEPEMVLSLPRSFFLVDAAGNSVHEGDLTARSDTGWNTDQEQYEHVLEADFSAFTTPGTYRLRVPGLGASFPFNIDNHTALQWARTYALGLYHQRCGGANELPFSRFTHGVCHALDAFIPSAPAYPDLCSFQFHDGRLSCYNYPGCENGTGCGVFDTDHPCGSPNPNQTAPLMCHFAGSVDGSGGTLYPFLFSGTKDVSLGHHDAGDYSKYLINSAQFIHILVFAADNFPGVASLNNLGIPESGNTANGGGVGDLLDEAKWEADFLLKMQDSDGGFYFLVYPEYSQYEFGTPDRGQRQVLYPKTTAVTASAVAALADIASSPAFQARYPSKASEYLTAAVNGWTFLTQAIDAHGKQGAYQKITHYGDDYMHDDELLWAAAAMFAATGSPTYHNQFLAWLPATFPQYQGYSRLFGGWGCAARDYAFAVRSGRLAGGLNAAALSQCENELLDAGEDWTTRSQDTSYGTGLQSGAKTQFQVGWYWSTDAAFEIAAADALDQTLASGHSRYDATRHGRFLPAMVENFNYQHGCNPLNQPYVTGVGSKRQRVIVHQYINYPNYDKRLLPPSGIPIGNMSDTYNNSTLNNISYPALSSSGAGYALYDRWTDAFNLRTEFVILQSARALAAAAYLHNFSGAAYQQWRKADGYFSFPNGDPVLNSPTVVRLDCDDPNVNLDEAQITWDVEFEDQPAFGRTFTVKPRTTIGATLVEAEAVFPDGRRVFGRQYLNISSPSGDTEFPDPPDNSTVALYHFDNPDPLWRFGDSSDQSYTLAPNGIVDLGGNVAWMASPSGMSAKFTGEADRLQTTTISDSLLRVNQEFTLEARIYVKGYGTTANPTILTLSQPEPNGDNYNVNWSLYFDTPTAPRFYGPKGQMLISATEWTAAVPPNTWHWLKVTVDNNGTTTTIYIDDLRFGPFTTNPSIVAGRNWTLSMGNFVGDFDEVRVSNTLRESTP